MTAILSLSSGCSWSVGGSKGNSSCPAPAQPTRGQELIDLQKANDSGAISDADYEKAKQQIISQ